MKFDLNIDNIKYVKIVYSNQNGNTCSMKAALKKINENEIIACFKFEENFCISTPQEVTASFVCPEGLYRTKTTLKSYFSDDNYIIMYLDKPKDVEYRQNREYFRVPISYKCTYKVDNNGMPAIFDGTIADISANGVSIMLPVLIFSEEDAEIDITTPDKIISAKVRYIRSERLKDGYKLSFTYTDISNKDRDYISQACILKQLEYKRNSAN